VGAPFVAVFLVYLLVRRLGWRALVAFALPWALITAGYATLYDVQHGSFTLNQWGGRYLYGEVAPFADCSRLNGLPSDERALCPDPRLKLTTQAALWGSRSPIHGLPTGADGRVRDFALRVIRDRPVTYARVVAHSFIHYFEPGRRVGPNDYKPAPWRFPIHPATPDFPRYRGPIRPEGRHGHTPFMPNRYVSRMVTRPHTNARASRLLRTYQRYGYTQGPLLAACVLVVLVALLRRGRDWRLRLDGGLLVAATLTALLVASALTLFSYRYVLTAVVLLPPAAALALTALLPPRLRRAP
jgi:hypothetical protein